jgi:hypothetical protein
MYPGATTRNNHRRAASQPPRPEQGGPRCRCMQSSPIRSRARGPQGIVSRRTEQPAVAGDQAAARCCVLRGTTRGWPCSRPRSGPPAFGRAPLRPHRVTPTPPAPRQGRQAATTSGISNMPIPGSPPPTYEGSTTPRSFTPAMSSQHRMIPRRYSSRSSRQSHPATAMVPGPTACASGTAARAPQHSPTGTTGMPSVAGSAKCT